MIRIFTVLILFSHFNYGQKFKITYGDTFITNRGFSDKFTEPNSDAMYFINYYPLSSSNTEFWLNKLDLQTAKFQYRFNLHDSVKTEVTSYKAYYHKTVHLFGSRIVFFTRVVDKGVDRLMMTSFDSKTGRRLLKPTDVYEISNKNLSFLSNGSSNFIVVTSPDQTKFAVVSERKEDFEEQDVHVHIFDATNFHMLWEAKAPGTFTNSTLFTSDYQLSNDGKLYFLFRYKQDLQDHLYGVGMLKSGRDKAIMTALTHKEKWVVKPQIELTANGVSLHGGYIETKISKLTPYGPSGFYDAIFTTDVQLLGEVTVETKESFGIKNEAQICYNQVGTFNIGKDWYIVREHSYFLPPDLTIEEELFVTKINKDGKLEWLKRVPKRVEAQDCLSLLMRADEKELQLIYFEDKKNIELYPDLNNYQEKKYKPVRKRANASLVCVSVLPDGSLKRSVIETNGTLYLPYTKHQNHLTKDGKTFVVKSFDRRGKKSYCLLEIN